MSRYILLLLLLLVGIQHSTCLHTFLLPLRSKRAAVQWKDNNLHGRVEKGYYVEVMMGTPPQKLDILIDTGSSNFAVASGPHPYISKYYNSTASSTAQDMNIPEIDIEYTEGFWKGHLVTDLVSIPDAGLSEQSRVSIAKITSSKQFFINESGWQGILGMGYGELVRPANMGVKPFMQSVKEQTDIKDIFSMQLCMANIENFSDETGGTLIIGGYDSSINESNIYWTKIVHKWYYDVTMIGMKVGNDTISMDCMEFNNDKCIVDSGTTNLHLPSKVFDEVIRLMKAYLHAAMPNFTIDDDFWTGKSVLCWARVLEPFGLFPTLTIFLPSSTSAKAFSLLLHPRHYLLYYGKDSLSEKVCYKFGISSSTTGTVLGAVLMEQYIVIFDRENERVGFTWSNCSHTSDLSYLNYPNSTSCVYSSSHSGPSPLQIAMYVLLGLLLIASVPVCVLMYVWCYSKEKDTSLGDTSELLNSPPK